MLKEQELIDIRARLKGQDITKLMFDEIKKRTPNVKIFNVDYSIEELIKNGPESSFLKLEKEFLTGIINSGVLIEIDDFYYFKADVEYVIGRKL